MPTVPTVDFIGSPQFFGEGLNGANRAVQTAEEQINLSEEYIRRLGDMVGGIEVPVINPAFPEVGGAPSITTVPMPSLDDIEWVQPPMPEAFTGTLTIDDIMPEPFEEDAPLMVFPAAPTEPSEEAPEVPGIDLVYTEPELEVTLPAAPQLLSISVGRFTGLNIPTFDADMPDLVVTEPGPFNFTPGAAYTSALLTYMRDRAANGGTGLNADVENAIWDRAREREYRQKNDALLALDDFEALGYSFPPGVYLDARVKIETEINYNISTVSREIMVKQAELEQTNIENALKNATQLEGQMITSYNQYQERLFQAAKTAVEVNVEIYNAKVRSYGAMVDAYKTRAAVYEAQVRAEVTKVEAYKAEVDAELAKAQVNRAIVDSYKAQIDAALSNIEIFKARLAGIQTKADIEKAKIQIYGEQVRAYLGKINIYSAQIEAYKAQVQTEGVKQEAFKSQVQAYVAQVEAGSKVSEARIREFEARISAKGIEYDAFKSRVQAESARVQGIAAANQAVIEGFKAEVSGVSAYNEALTKQWEAQITLAARIAEIGVQTAKMNAELYITARQIAIEAAKVGAQVSAQLGAAALNAINYNNSISYSNSNSSSRSGTASDSASESTSNSESRSENYNYNSSV